MKMETLFILSNMREYGGAEHSIATLLPHFLETTRVFIFVENDRHTAALRKIESDRLTVISLPKGNSPLAMWHSLRTLRSHCLAEQPRALLANGHKGGLMLALLQALLPGPRPRCAVYVRDFDYYTLRYTLWAMRDFQFFAPTRAIFEHTPYRNWGLNGCRHEVISNAVVAPDELIAPAENAERFVGCCARITPWKGIEYLIRAFAQAAPPRPDARLRIYGDVIDREYFDTLNALTDELGIRPRVTFCEFTPDIAQVFRDGLFFVIPSLSISPGPESFGRIVIEAWSFARPVVSFAAGGPRTLIENGEDGFLVEERNVEELAARIGELLDHPALRERMGAAGREKVRTQFDPATIAQTVLNRLLPAPTLAGTELCAS